MLFFDHPRRHHLRAMNVTLLRLVVIAVSACIFANAADLKTQNVFLIMTDGLRWQEVFTGAEEMLISRQPGGVKNTNGLRAKFWHDTPEARRAVLMPFMWNEIARKGQIFGNQQKGSVVTVSNGKNFSYPGYNEIFTGYGDPRIDSNDKKPNPNITVFEWIHRQKPYRGKVAAIATWDVFPFILNCQRSGIPIWPAWAEKYVSEIKAPPMLNRLIVDTPRVGSSVIFDSFAMHLALDYVKREKPRVAFIGFGETDEFAHAGRYDEYLTSANRVDSFIREFWTLLQSISQYRDKTTLIITADHGRGIGPEDWKHHSAKLPESAANWVAVLGPDTPPLGERSNTTQQTSAQIAATIAQLLGLDYRAFFSEAAEPIKEVIQRR